MKENEKEFEVYRINHSNDTYEVVIHEPEKKKLTWILREPWSEESANKFIGSAYFDEDKNLQHKIKTYSSESDDEFEEKMIGFDEFPEFEEHKEMIYQSLLEELPGF
jgi:hypothetical protein